MRLDSPERPRWLNGLPMYVDASGKACAPMPRLCLVASGEGQVRVSIMCKVGNNEFTEFHLTCQAATLLELLSAWEKCPEDTMEFWFGYIPIAGSPGKGYAKAQEKNDGRREFGLDDLEF
jgi:hypothetical protein